MPTRGIRLLGHALCAIVGAPELIGWVTRRSSAHGGVWIACYCAFVVGFELWAATPLAARRRRAMAIALQACAMTGMALSAPCHFAALTLVVIALQAALALAPIALAAGLAAQTVVISFLVMRGCIRWESLSWLMAVSGLQAAVAVAASLARRESDARAGLARAHAELQAAHALLAEASRTDERDRIARELHDVLGHNLTALGLQLEVAKNVAPEQMPAHVGKARVLAAEALTGLRHAVSAMRATSSPDVGRALRALCAETPGLRIHLQLPEPLLVECPARAHCLVRCVQEIVTNTLRHAEAETLWIRVERTSAFLTVDARDDGRGAAELRAGNGIAGMRARLEEMGGRLAVVTLPTFSLSARLPVADAP